MTNRLKHNLKTWLVYSFVAFILLKIVVPIGWSIVGSIMIGFTWGMMNDILTQLRKLNGEKFEGID